MPLDRVLSCLGMSIVYEEKAAPVTLLRMTGSRQKIFSAHFSGQDSERIDFDED